MNDFFRSHVLATTGGAPDVIEPGRLHRFSTNGRRSDAAGWCKLFADGRGGICGDWRSGVVSSWRAERAAPLLPCERARIAAEIDAARAARIVEQRRQWASQAPRLAGLWAATDAILPGDAASLYLKRRGLVVTRFPEALRFVARLAYQHDDGSRSVHPAMLGAVLDPAGKLVAIHRTYLRADGAKADVPEPKKLTRTAGPLAGAAIRLHAMRADGVLGVSEGIETAIAATLGSSVPTWAAVSAHGLASLAWPPGARRLIVFGDHDAGGAGQRAAAQLAERARAAGLSVSVLLPAKAGTDWADVWAQHQAREVTA